MIELTADTRLGRVLDALPGALEYVVSLNPHDFSRLRNPIMRKYMAPRISLGRIAAIVSMPEERLLGDLAALSNGAAQVGAPAAPVVRPQSPASEPAWVAAAEAGGLHHVDVLRIDDVLGDPLPPINAAIKRLAPDGVLVIHHRWEPQPLYDVWTKIGLEWFARQASAEEWQIFVHRPTGVQVAGQQVGSTVDLRHLPATERAPRLVTMFEQLQPGEGLVVWAEAVDWLAEVKAALEHAHSGSYTWEQQDGPDRLSIRIVRPARRLARPCAQ